MSINKTHAFSEGVNGFQISPHLQELLVYAGQLDCYERCNVILEKFIDVEVSATQVYLVRDYYGQAVKKEVNVCRSLEPVKKEEVLYVEADGSMLLTRDGITIMPANIYMRLQPLPLAMKRNEKNGLIDKRNCFYKVK